MKLPSFTAFPLLLLAACGGGASQAFTSTTDTQTTTGAGGASVTPLSATAIAVGAAHSCALLPEGTVACWGDGARGQLGDGTSGSDYYRTAPALVPGLTGALAIDAGGDTTCAITGSGVLCWGAGDMGQLGDGTAADGHASASPVAVPDLATAVSISVTGSNACAALADGTVRCWGRNANEAWLGFESSDCGPYVVVASDGSTTLETYPCEPAPRLVPGAVSAAAVTSGGQHNCLLREDGGVRCWGADHFGQLGDGDSGPDAHHPEPVEVKDLTAVTRLALGISHTTAVVGAEGTLRAFGGNDLGQLGIGTSGLDSYKVTPVAIPGPAGVLDIHATGRTTCAATAGAGVLCWGDTSAVLPASPEKDGSSLVPMAVPGLGGAAEVRTSGGHACARAGDLTVRCWGKNDRGQLGNGATGLGDYSMAVVGAAGAPPG